MKKISVIASRHWKALLGFNTVVLLLTLGAIATTPKTWKATAQLILPATNGGSLNADLGTLGSYRTSDPSFSNQVNPLKIQQAILTSDALLEKAWTSDPENNQQPKPRNYEKFFSVTSLEQTSVMTLSVTGSSPEVAKRRTTALLKAYSQRLDDLREANNRAKEGFSQKQLDKARQKLTEAQTALAQFKQESGLVNSEEQTKGLVEAVNTLSTSQAQAEAQAQASRGRAKILETRLRLSPDEAVQSLGLDQNEDYKSLRSKLTEAESNLGKVRSIFTDRTPQVQKALSDREALRSQLQKYVNRSVGSIKADTTVTSGAEGRGNLIQQLVTAEAEANGQQQQAEQLQKQIDQRRASLTAIPAVQAKLIPLQRQADVAEGVYKGLIAQVQQSNIDAFSAYPNIQELNPPVVDSNPASPKLSVMAINALLASLVGSIALVLLLETRNPLLNPKDLQTIKFPLVTRIPHLKCIAVGSDLSTEGEIKFQRLASAISLQPLENTRLLITSAITGEGKTAITLRLSFALTDLGFRVLMVDGDFRNAGLSRQLGYARNLSTGVEVIPLRQNLDFVPTMPQQSRIVDLVTQGRFEQYLAAVQSTQDYDYVLVDSAPVSLTSETALMATIVPSVLFVVRPGLSARNAVNDSLDQLTQHKANVVGLVINGVEAQSRSYPDQANSTLTNRS